MATPLWSLPSELQRVFATEDGTRLWHKRFHVRQVGDRRAAIWLGVYNYHRSEAFPSAQSDLPPNLRHHIITCLGGSTWEEKFPHELGVERHLEPCDVFGWVGASYLPKNYLDPDQPWPKWKHLLHCYDLQVRFWEGLVPAFEAVTRLADGELIQVVETGKLPWSTRQMRMEEE